MIRKILDELKFKILERISEKITAWLDEEKV